MNYISLYIFSTLVESVKNKLILFFIGKLFMRTNSLIIRSDDINPYFEKYFISKKFSLKKRFQGINFVYFLPRSIVLDFY